MRASEFIFENTSTAGKLHKDQESVMDLTHAFSGTADRIYDLNRVMLAAACSDGEKIAKEVDRESWIGRNNLAVPFSEVEHKMIHHAFRLMGASSKMIVKDRSSEPDDTHKASPVAPRRKNRYGV